MAYANVRNDFYACTSGRMPARMAEVSLSWEFHQLQAGVITSPEMLMSTDTKNDRLKTYRDLASRIRADCLPGRFARVAPRLLRHVRRGDRQDHRNYP